MTGGLLNIVSYGNQNVILNGNPKKTFFKATYAKYTNFGLQKFRIDFTGQRSLRLTTDSTFTFYVPRYADLLMDTYIVVTLPTIWSPIWPASTDCTRTWAPFEFQWIENLGTQMIKEIRISVGGQTLQVLTGKYLLALVQRDFSGVKRALYDNMTGNIPLLNDPANSSGRVNMYPNAYYTTLPQGSEPSIRSRKLYIPINAWFTLSYQMAFPLIALQYNELKIDVVMRPIQDLYTIRDVMDPENGWPIVRPNYTNEYMQLYRFLQSPPSVSLNSEDYQNPAQSEWNADIHLMSTYAFLSNQEAKEFAATEQKYLIKSAYEWNFQNVTGSQRVWLENTLGMVSNWMFFFQRSDINLRNQWSNYTNWPYSFLPSNIIPGPVYPSTSYNGIYGGLTVSCNVNQIGPGYNTITGNNTGFFITQPFSVDNQRDILLNLAILFDGKYRENVLDAGVYNYIEKYIRTPSNAPDGLYCYNFGLDTDPFNLQPSGAVNTSKFSNIQFEFTTFYPPLDPSANFLTICDPTTRLPIGVNKPTWRIYDYNYNLVILEERYNVIRFMSGNAGLMYAR
jgi:Major capsid protein N-terminus/Large eukaryotic DNA virus major capsid protein